MPANPTPFLALPKAELSEEEAQAVVQRAKALQVLLEEKEVKAKYRLELMFGSFRSDSKSTPGAITFWESGNKLHGGGDTKLYMCPQSKLNKGTCSAMIPEAHHSRGRYYCVSCGSVWQEEDVIGEVFFNLPMQKWAEVLYNYYRRLNMDCDVCLRYARGSIRATTRDYLVKPSFAGDEKMDKTRAGRVRYTYPLRNIIRDLSTGADPLKRFYAFLTI